MSGNGAITLRQIRSVVAVLEEGSFTRAAAREHATQSGVSQHVAAVEAALGVRLFTRGPEGVRPTPAGRNYYGHCIAVLRALETGANAARAAGGRLAGQVRAGLMPAFTRAALAPALERLLARHPEIEARVTEGYSAALTEAVRADALDFALVPGIAGGEGLRIAPLARDREMLVSGARAGLPHGVPVRLAELGPLKVVVPGASNARRPRLEEYFASQGARIARRLEMDAMLGTLELVARSDWVTVLPSMLCRPDADGRTRRVAPLDGPPLHSDFVVIEPARRPLSPQAAAFLDELRAEIAALVTA